MKFNIISWKLCRDIFCILLNICHTQALVIMDIQMQKLITLFGHLWQVQCRCRCRRHSNNNTVIIIKYANISNTYKTIQSNAAYVRPCVFYYYVYCDLNCNVSQYVIILILLPVNTNNLLLKLINRHKYAYVRNMQEVCRMKNVHVYMYLMT